MSTFTFAPALGWPAGIVIVVVMAALAVVEIVQYVRRRSVRPVGDTDETAGSCIRRVLMLLLVAVMALTPSTATATTSRAVSATDVVIATDITGSMAVDDAQYGSDETMSRLDAAKLAIEDLTRLYANSSFAAVSFGATGNLDVPLTPDTGAIDTWAQALTTEPTSTSAGSSLDAGLDTLITTLKSIRDEHPDDRIILYFITDGEQTSPTSPRTFSTLRDYLTDSCVIGVGSEAGGKIPAVTSGGQTTGEYVKDPSTGEDGISKLDVAEIKELADELSGSYILLGPSATVDNTEVAQQSSKWRVTSTARERIRTSPIVWPFAIALAVLLAWELGVWIATSRRLL
ncbi:vWA domain-containing protein [Bifidobacterium choloepi]|uniref:VWA domain-containing protein n=1 Tax=Bifidobacterium choloepi TaxID=2614131 RepID=A0A6I5N151_9BIFI|nr:vWA domain-containing protein [Bifidobacterium choloepi]NEG69379.1 VWA domain-containing protein [Bifidobacterium choloepi]